MNESVKKANKIKFETIIKNLAKRNMEGYYCDSAEDACDKGLSFIKDNACISWGGSATLSEIGFFEKLKSKNPVLIDGFSPPSPEEAYEHFRKAFSVDYFLMSTNAITLDGKLINIDGTGNRVAALIYGPREVLVFAGANKVVFTEEDAVSRIRTYACTANAARLNKNNTPCVLTGKCGDCLLPEGMCSHTVITRYSKVPGRIKVLLINDNLGF